MPQKSEYRVITGTHETIGQLIAPITAQGFKPILVTSTAVTVPPLTTPMVMITLVLERILGS
jgi:hypothetical protein